MREGGLSLADRGEGPPLFLPNARSRAELAGNAPATAVSQLPPNFATDPLAELPLWNRRQDARFYTHAECCFKRIEGGTLEGTKNKSGSRIIAGVAHG